MAQKKIYLHCFLDGRDTPPRSAEASLKRFQDLFAKLGKGRIASIVGRYYAMDRDNNWDRVEKAYDLLTLAQGEFTYDSAVEALQAAYAREENDEFVKQPKSAQRVKNLPRCKMAMLYCS